MRVCRFSSRRGVVSGLVGAALLLVSAGGRADDIRTPPPVPPLAPAPTLDFSVKTAPYRPIAGGAATLTVTLKPTTTPVGKEKHLLAGLFIVREDLGQLFFDEPAATATDNTTFEDKISLPSGGEWRVFGSVMTLADPHSSVGTESIVGPVKVSIDGARTVREPMIPQMLPSVRVGTYTLSLKQPTRITTGDEQKLAFTLLDGQTQEVSDMDIWRDSLAHLVLVDRDAKTLLHITPDRSDPRTGRTGTLVFPTRFPKAGIWRGWVLFHRNAQVCSLPIVLRVLGH